MLRRALARAARPVYDAYAARAASASYATQPHQAQRELYDRSRQQIPLGELYPSVANSSFVAPNATLVGDVNVGDGCYVGYGVVLRGDQSPVEIYHKARIGDRSVLSAAAAVATGMNAETVVGNMCSVGAGCLLRSATLDAFAVVGDGCVLEEGTIMEECSELLPGSVLPAGYRVPAGEVYGGAPAEFVRELSKYEAFERRRHANDAYASNTVAHRDEFLPNGGPWKESEARREELRELLDQKTFQEGQLPVPV